MLYNTEKNFGSVAKFLHWLMALMIGGMVSIAWTMKRIHPGDLKAMLYSLHKATGILLLMLVILRLAWRLTQLQPSLPADMPRWQQRTAKSNFVLLYVLMVAMPVSGLLMSILNGHPVSFYGLFTIEALAQKHPLGSVAYYAHQTLSYLLVGAVTLHVAAAFYHYFVRKDDVLQRMLPHCLGGKQIFKNKKSCT